MDWRIERLSPVECDPGLMKQAFFNLFSNALKFTRNQERAVVEAGEVCFNDQLVIFVRDNGVGFDEQYADKLFQVFQRLHGKSEYPGSGIGLAICKKIVENHNGAIWIDENTAKGAKIFFTLPKNNFA